MAGKDKKIIPFSSQELDIGSMTLPELESYRQELQQELTLLDSREPKNPRSEAYEEWAEDHEELEDLMDEVEDLLEDLRR